MDTHNMFWLRKNINTILLKDASYMELWQSWKVPQWGTYDEYPQSILFSWNTVITLSIGTDRLKQTVQTQIRCHRVQHLIRIYTVSHSSSTSTGSRKTCSNLRTSMVRSEGVQIFRVNMVLIRNASLRTQVHIFFFYEINVIYYTEV